MPSPAYNPRFDSLRGWAAFFVVGVHCNSIIPFGWIGLLSFYVLSGYLVTRSWQGVTREGLGAGSYFYRRVLRIFPLYYFYLGLLFLLASLGTLPRLWDVFPSLLFGYFSWMKTLNLESGSFFYSHLWSLSVEFQFYLMLPLFFLLIPKRWQVRALWGLVLVTPVLRVGMYALALHWGFVPWEAAVSVYGFALNYLDAFALGMLLAVSPGVSSRGAFRRLCFYTAGLATVLFCFSLLVSPPRDWVLSWGFPLLMVDYFQWAWGYSLLHLFFYFLIGWLITGPRLPFLFDNVVTRYLGEISYGIYVYHLGVVSLVFYGLGISHSFSVGTPVSWGVFVLIYLISVGLASMSYYFLERRFLKLR